MQNNELFEEFEICTEHFYNELGKLSACEEHLSKKEIKYIKKKIVDSLFKSIDTIVAKENLANKAESVFASEEHSAFKEEHNMGVYNKVKNGLKLAWEATKRVFKRKGINNEKQPNEVVVQLEENNLPSLPENDNEKENIKTKFIEKSHENI